MISVVITCPHCGADFEVDGSGKVACWSCHNNVMVDDGLFPRAANPPVIPIPVTPQASPPPASRSRIFYYVFWGVISLAGTVFLIVAGLLFFGAVGAGLISGNRNVVAAAPSRNASPEYLPALSVIDSARATEIAGGLYSRHDAVEDITWQSPVSFSDYETRVYLYLGDKKGQRPWLRFKIRYYGDDWLFVERFKIKVDDQEAVAFGKRSQIDRENGAGSVWEIFDEDATDYSRVINQMLNGQSVVLRMEGSSGVKDVTLTEYDRGLMQNALLVYRSRGGQWPKD